MRRVSTALVALTAAATLGLLAGPASAAPDDRSFNVSPKTVRAGQQVKAFGKGCNRNAFVRIYLDGIQIETDRADRRGRFVDWVEIPNSADEGQHRMRASCSGRGLGSVKINVLRSRFRVSPRRVEQGDTVTVSGSGCRPGSYVTIKLDGRTIGDDRASRQGKFIEAVQIPLRTRVGRHVISARCGGRFVGSQSIQVLRVYPAPLDLLTTDRTAVPAGQAVTVSGTDCPTGQPLASLDGQQVNLNVDYTAKSKGFTATVTVPSSAIPGKHKLTAGCDAGSAGTTELHVLDPATTESAAARQAFGPQPTSNLAMWAGLFAGIALLVASLGVTRRRRS
jgi:hypothetical protein